eukprot:scaffold15263_cov92-Isochrysis_galbana.AAC.1
MTGTKDRYTGSGKIWPKKSAEKRQVKRGSAVLTTLVKATVPYAGATVESRCPAARHPAMGVSLRTSSKDRTGGARACSGAARPGRGIGVQRSRRVSTPTSSWAAADVHGKFQFDSTCDGGKGGVRRAANAGGGRPWGAAAAVGRPADALVAHQLVDNGVDDREKVPAREGQRHLQPRQQARRTSFYGGRGESLRRPCCQQPGERLAARLDRGRFACARFQSAHSALAAPVGQHTRRGEKHGRQDDGPRHCFARRN